MYTAYQHFVSVNIWTIQSSKHYQNVRALYRTHSFNINIIACLLFMCSCWTYEKQEKHMLELLNNEVDNYMHNSAIGTYAQLI